MTKEEIEEAKLIKRLLKSAWEEWLRGRGKTRIPSFNSKSAKSKVIEFVEQAIRSEDEMDVLQAVHELSREPDGAPWDIPKRAMRIGGDRRDLERTARRFEEREIVPEVARVLKPQDTASGETR